jgi:hypothetical protein
MHACIHKETGANIHIYIYTQPPPQYIVGQHVMCEDKGKVYEAVVKEVDDGMRIMRVLLHFPGWNARYDQWLSADSNRLRPGQYVYVCLHVFMYACMCVCVYIYIYSQHLYVCVWLATC